MGGLLTVLDDWSMNITVESLVPDGIPSEP